MGIVKNIIQRTLNSAGYEIRRTKRFTDPFVEQRRLLADTPQPVIFDIGAQFGQSTKKYLNYFPDATIYSFEPFPDSFLVLSKNYGGRPNIRLYNLAVGNRMGEATFYSNKCSAANSLLQTDKQAKFTWGKGFIETQSSFKVKITTLDDFVVKNGIKRIDILKMDTQGSEHQIIEGAGETFKNNSIKLIFTEIITMPTYAGQKELYEVLEIMHRHNFILYKFFNESLVDGYLRQLDAVFLNKNYKFPEIDRNIAQFNEI